MDHFSNQQTVWAYDGDRYLSLDLPPPSKELVPGVFWGCAGDVFSPAFWKYQSHMLRSRGYGNDFQLGKTLLEEVCVCLLGGYGMPAELGLAAFKRLANKGLISSRTTIEKFESELSKPFKFGTKLRKYRFISQKSRYLHGALQAINQDNVPDCPTELRAFLTTIPGIGPKTASWIVRNHKGSDEVAILDIHIIRAGISIGLFEPNSNPTRDYFELERRFLHFCIALDEPASLVDAMMWEYMRRIGPTASSLPRITH